MTVFLVAYASFLKSCKDGNVHTYATTKELKKKTFTINSLNINQEISIQVTFIFDINSLKHIFYQNMTIFLVNYAYIVSPC